MPVANTRSISTRTYCLASAVVVLLSIPFLINVCTVLQSNVDESVITLGADLINRGGLIYKDFHTPTWPGAFLLLSFVYKIFGDSFLVGRALVVVELVLCQILLLAFCRGILSSWLALIPPVALVVLGPPGWNFNSHCWDALLFYFACAYLLLRVLKESGQHKLSAWLAGVCGALAVLCYQGTGPAIALAMLSTCYLRKEQSSSWKTAVADLALMLAGASLVMICFFTYLLATDSLSWMLDCGVRQVFSHYGSVNSVPYGFNGFFDKMVLAPSITPGQELTAIFKVGLGLVTWFPYELYKDAPFLVLAFIVFSMLSKISIGRALLKYPGLLICLSMGYPYWLVQLHRPDIIRLFWGSQLLFVALLFFLEKSPKIWPASRLAVRLVAGLLVLTLVFSALTSFYRFWQAKYVLHTRRGEVRSFEPLPIVQALEDNLSVNATILAYPYATTIMFLSRTTYPSRYPILQYHYHPNEAFTSVIADMEAKKLPFAVWDSALTNQSFKDNGFPAYVPVEQSEEIMENYLRGHYDFVKSYGHFRLMRRKPGI